MGRLEGKVAIITGTGRGTGAVHARRFVEESYLEALFLGVVPHGGAHALASSTSGQISQPALIAETSNSSTILSLTSTPPVSRAAFQVTP